MLIYAEALFWDRKLKIIEQIFLLLLTKGETRLYLGGKRYQLIDIYFYGVGIIKELTPEEMETEYQKLAKQEKSA